MRKHEKVPKISEAHVERTCSEWLALDQWRSVITDPKHIRGLGVSEKGIADRQYIRYGPDIQGATFDTRIEALACIELMWIEWKRPGKRVIAGSAQDKWHDTERARGALTLRAGTDFEASIEGFQDFYRKSGLRRNQSL